MEVCEADRDVLLKGSLIMLGRVAAKSQDWDPEVSRLVATIAANLRMHHTLQPDAYVAVTEVPALLAAEPVDTCKLRRVAVRVANNAVALQEQEGGLSAIPFGKLFVVASGPVGWWTNRMVVNFVNSYTALVMEIVRTLTVSPADAAMYLLNDKYAGLREQLALELVRNRLLGRIIALYSADPGVNLARATFKGIYLNLFNTITQEEIATAFKGIATSIPAAAAESYAQSLFAFLGQGARAVVETAQTAAGYEFVMGPGPEKMHNELMAKLKNASLDTEHGFRVLICVLIGMAVLLYLFLSTHLINWWRSRRAIRTLQDMTQNHGPKNFLIF